jgi:hypothetical protein
VLSGVARAPFLGCNNLNSILRTAPTSRQLSDTVQHSGSESQLPCGRRDRHRSSGYPLTPATPPCVRVRTRRFEMVTLDSPSPRVMNRTLPLKTAATACARAACTHRLTSTFSCDVRSFSVLKLYPGIMDRALSKSVSASPNSPEFISARSRISGRAQRNARMSHR